LKAPGKRDKLEIGQAGKTAGAARKRSKKPMGYNKAVLRLMIRSFRDEECSGRVLTFGRNGVDASYQDLLEMFRLEKKNHRTLEPSEIELDPLTQFGNSIHQDVFFKLLGFTEVHSVDYFDNEKPTFVLDLNKKIPASMEERYDLVSDAGTLEHCFDVKEVLFNTVRLLKPGGFVCFHTPMSGLVDHGFYNFSPTLFWDFYGKNGFERMQMSILEEYSNRSIRRYDYDPGIAEIVGDLFKKSGIFFVARKRALSEIRVPIQGYYRSTFGGESAPAKKAAWKESVKKILGSKFAYFLYRMSLRFRRFIILNFRHERM
jgi:SAM-dependent methyltransferase